MVSVSLTHTNQTLFQIPINTTHYQTVSFPCRTNAKTLRFLMHLFNQSVSNQRNSSTTPAMLQMQHNNMMEFTLAFALTLIIMLLLIIVCGVYGQLCQNFSERKRTYSPIKQHILKFGAFDNNDDLTRVNTN